MSDVLVVDVANVVGSRPDGWWRDRAGAARRLYDQVLAGGLGTVVLIIEGAAKAGAEPGEASGVRVVHAAASGDDAVVEVVVEAVAVAADGGSITVVTSDRELRRRVSEIGAEVVGPRRLLDRLG